MADTISLIRVQNWFETFLTAEQIEEWAEANGDASVEDLYQRIFDQINSGQRTVENFVTSLINGTDDNGVFGITNMITRRGLTAADVLAGLVIPGLDLRTATTETIAIVLSEALTSGLITSVMLQENLDGVEPGIGATLPVLDPSEPPDIPDPDPVDDPDPEDVTTLTFEQQVQLLFPWLPVELQNVYSAAWEDTGSTDLALATMRADPLYENFFAGNLRDDGTARLSEGEYIATIEGYTLTALSYGLNPAVFTDDWIEAIENGLSVDEVSARFELAFDGILGIELAEVREFYSAAYGVEMTDEAIFAAIVSPNVSTSIIEGQVAVSQVGAAGLVAGFGFEETLPEAERLAALGLGQGQALTFFGEAAGRVPVLSMLARRFRDADPTFDLSEFTDAEVFGDAFQRRRAARLLARERALFTRSGTVRQDQSGALTGLEAT